MSTAEIIAELAHLAPSELAAVRAWLEQHPPTASSVAGPDAPSSHRSAPRLRSPRLANPSLAGDFVKQIVRPDAHAAV